MDTPTWAHRLAQRCKARDAALASATKTAADGTPNAISILWGLFGEAVKQANTALESSGADERVLLHRTTRDYRLSMVGPTGEERQMAVAVSVTQVGGRPSGVAHITTNQTPARITLFAASEVSGIRWIISPTDTPLTGQVIGDLFLSVFSYDPAASTGLSPYWTLND